MGARNSRPVQDDVPPPFPVEPRYETKTVCVLGKRMAYYEAGDPSGDPIVFVHGNPTSKFMWRNVMPHCESLGARLIAPDLIGMGESEKLEGGGDPDRYSLKNQSRYLSAFFDAVGVRERVILIGHSWGGTLAAHWGSQHQAAVRGLVCLEVVYVPFPSWERVPKKIRGGVKLLKREKRVCCLCCAFDIGAYLILKKNLMLESMPQRVARKLTDAEMAHYRKGYEEKGESRRPILSFIRSIPVAGEPGEGMARQQQGPAEVVCQRRAGHDDAGGPRLCAQLE